MNRIGKGIIIAAALVLPAFGLSACGEEGQEEKYSSPNFITETVKSGEKYTETTEKPEVVPSGLTEGDPVDGKDTNVDIDYSAIVGTREENAYYNPFAGFAVKVDGSLWQIYDAAGVAAATGQTETEVTDQWYGVVSPYSLKTTTCAIAYDTDTGTNLIVSYVNPKLYYMQNMTAREYLEMSSSQYKDAEVRDVEYLGGIWTALFVGEETEGVGRRAQFALRKDDLIVLLTYTLQGEDTLDDAAQHVSRLIIG